MPRSAKDRHYAGKGQDRLFGTGAKFLPALIVLFGREEMDAASGEGPVFRPLLERNVDIAAYSIR